MDDRTGGPVLLVDDEEVVRNVVKASLERHGFEVTVAPDGERGLACFRECPERFALVVLDVSLPGIDGLTVRRAVRELRADVPIVLSTGLETDRARDACAEDPMTSLLEKPFGVSELVRCVREVTG